MTFNERLRCKIVMSETPKFINEADKPFKAEEIPERRVDINVLKARAKATQDKENIKNSIIIILILISLGVSGIYLSI